MLKFISYNTRLTNNDLNISVNLSSKNELNGLSDGMNEFIENETSLSINPADDYEIEKYNQDINYTFNFYFYNTGTTTYNNTLVNAGFDSTDELTDFIYKSYFVFSLYDSINSESQTLLHTGYYSGYLFPTGLTSSYEITTDMEINNFYLKNIDLTTFTGDTFYLKLGFFNAKSGKQQLFYNQSNSGDATENIFYFNVTLDRDNLTYGIDTPINAREFINYTYVNKINENINVIPEEKVQYPTGGTALNGNTYFNL